MSAENFDHSTSQQLIVLSVLVRRPGRLSDYAGACRLRAFSIVLVTIERFFMLYIANCPDKRLGSNAKASRLTGLVGPLVYFCSPIGAVGRELTYALLRYWSNQSAMTATSC